MVSSDVSNTLPSGAGHESNGFRERMAAPVLLFEAVLLSGCADLGWRVRSEVPGDKLPDDAWK
jgi:hypothetical protein